MGRDPDYLAYIRSHRAQSPPPGRRRLAEVRAAAVQELARLPRPAVGHVKDLTIDGPAGPLPARLYRPDAAAAPAPGLVFFHGGGWILGDMESYDPVARALTLACGVAVVSVDYRRPPEAPFPAPVDDATAAYTWVRENAADLGLHPARLGIAGDSAGGQLAAATSWRLHTTPAAPAAQVLIYPAVDLRAVPPDLPDPDGLPIPPNSLDRVLELYLHDTDRTLPEVSPLLAPDLTGMPPTVIATAEHDRLRPQGEAYAARLREAAVPTTLVAGTGLDHGFLGWGSFARRPAQVIAELGAAVHTTLT
ncbi:alpha/beta hydrolase [Actinomadura barringtoniae]|uniref:Alpha/beta hydrolase n=1 Tax=Actinomadura barringtoniae TaxID=1427535 RepID=A0A939PTZ3_9ACTN|nr:alpha/beta hydrolase [Actinomadura barringtoniae]MBO2454741.1 alpha/beta hydrolase [Actinomadura barringtoniae]